MLENMLSLEQKVSTLNAVLKFMYLSKIQLFIEIVKLILSFVIKKNNNKIKKLVLHF